MSYSTHHLVRIPSQRMWVYTVIITLFLVPACRRNETKAAHAETRPLTGIAMTSHFIEDLATLDVPRNWHIAHVEYPSRYGNQPYNVIQASFDTTIDTKGVLTVDISPSHPRLWRKPLAEWVEHRFRALRTLGTLRTQSLASDEFELAYQCEERSVTIDNRLRAVFRIFRQKSRVVVVTYTADIEHFDERAATQVVQHTSDTLVIELPVVPFQRPKLDLVHRTIPSVLEGPFPVGWAWQVEEQWDNTPVPIQTVIFEPIDDFGDRVSLTVAIARLSELVQQVHFEAVAIAPPHDVEFESNAENTETVLRVDEERMTVIRVSHVGSDVLTTTYNAPDYLFEVKPAYELLDHIVDNVRVLPLTAMP